MNLYRSFIMLGFILFLIIATLFLGSCEGQVSKKVNVFVPPNSTNMEDKINKSDEDWSKQLTPEQFNVLRKKGTEMAFTGKYYKNHEKGVYICAACGNELFSSENKYDSGCGWPSFYSGIREGKIDTAMDNTHGMTRIEIMCHKCGGHLGHVFDDGPKPTGLRYCVNSLSLDFKPEISGTDKKATSEKPQAPDSKEK